MLKQLSFILMLSPLLVACGGGGGVDKIVIPPKSSSSAPSSSSSSESSSESSSSSSVTVINVDMATGWKGNSGGEVGLSNEGVTLTASADGEGAIFDLTGVNLKDAIVDFVINVSAEYAASGSNIQPFAQVKTEGYPGEYDCWTNNVDLTAGVDQTISCTIDEDEFDQTANDVQIGLQAKGTMFSGTVLIKSVKITLASGGTPSSSSSSAASNQTVIPVDAATNWSNDGSTATFSVDNGIVVTPDWAAGDLTAMYVSDTVIDLTNATVTYVISVPQSYITDGAMVIQPFLQQNSGSYQGIFDGNLPGGWNPASGLTAGDNTITFGPFTNPPSDIARVGIKLNKQTKADGVTGDIIIRSIKVNH